MLFQLSGVGHAQPESGAVAAGALDVGNAGEHHVQSSTGLPAFPLAHMDEVVAVCWTKVRSPDRREWDGDGGLVQALSGGASMFEWSFAWFLHFLSFERVSRGNRFLRNSLNSSDIRVVKVTIRDGTIAGGSFLRR